MEISLSTDPSADERTAILHGLAEYNRTRAPPSASDLAVVIRQSGKAVGGLWGTCLYDWLAIELVFVPESLRGRQVGTQLIKSAEEAARGRGCIGAWLDTFSFQARGFYERLGYTVAGEIRDHPVGGARYFLSKRFASAQPPA